jgi:predicted lipoprotein with Yx(FWY)xxD motif
MKNIKTYTTLSALAAAVVVILSACGGSSNSSSGASAQPSSSAMRTVSVADVDGVGNVLVDSKSMALYAANQEAGGKVVCTESCTTIWEPLTLSAAQVKPSAASDLGGKLGVVKRPDGARQVTFNGRLLYRFAEDSSPLTVTGNGFSDSFDGTSFTWHVATPTGVSMSSSNSMSSSSSGGYGY